MGAASTGSTSVCNILLDAGVDVNQADKVRRVCAQTFSAVKRLALTLFSGRRGASGAIDPDQQDGADAGRVRGPR